MASHSPPDLNRRKTADSSTTLATLRCITGQGNLPQHVQQLFSCLSETVTQLLPAIHSLDDVCHKDVYTNMQFQALLKVIAELGCCAQSDLQKCQDLQKSESKVFGLTGSVLESDQEQMESSQDVTVNSVQPLPLEDRWQAVHTSICLCCEQLQNLQNLQLLRFLPQYTQAIKLLKSNSFSAGQVPATMDNSLAQHRKMEAQLETLRAQIIHEVGDSSLLAASCCCLCDVMKNWRRVDAWIYGELIPASEDQINSVLVHLGSMFHEYLGVLEDVTRLTWEVEDVTTTAVRGKIHEIENQVYSICWHMMKKPPSCVLESNKINLSVRVLGSQMKDVEAINVYIFPESDYNQRHTDQYLHPETKPKVISDSTGANVTVTKLDLKYLKKSPRPQKRSSAACCQQFYRVSFLVSRKSVGGAGVEWLSTPFNIRTGSQQLWEFVGAVRWYCFTAQDLYSPPFKCQPEMNVSQLLTMLQAMILTADPDKKLDCLEMRTLEEMLQTLTKTDNITLLDFVKHPMLKQGSQKSDRNGFPFFTWCVAALNTHKYLKEHTCLRDCCDFAGYDQSIQKYGSTSDRSGWIRISRNVVDSASSQLPFARVVVHVCRASRVKSNLFDHDKLKQHGLSRLVANWMDSAGNQLITTVQPHGLPVEQLDSSPEEPVKVNDYRTRTKTEVKEILLEDDFERIHISAPGDVSCTDLTNDDSGDLVSVKRARIQTGPSLAVSDRQPLLASIAGSSSLVSDRQPQLPSTAGNSSLVSDRQPQLPSTAGSSSLVFDRQSQLPSTAGSSSLVSDRQPQLHSTAGSSSLFSEILSSSDGNFEELHGSLSSPLSEEQLLLYSEFETHDVSSISSRPENQQQNQNPVPYNEESLYELLDHTMAEDGNSS